MDSSIGRLPLAEGSQNAQPAPSPAQTKRVSSASAPTSTPPPLPRSGFLLGQKQPAGSAPTSVVRRNSAAAPKQTCGKEQPMREMVEVCLCFSGAISGKAGVAAQPERDDCGKSSDGGMCKLGSARRCYLHDRERLRCESASSIGRIASQLQNVLCCSRHMISPSWRTWQPFDCEPL
jgi:hypothetical protein